MAKTPATTKQKLLAAGILAVICVFALFVAFVVTPAISASSGISDPVVSLAFAAVCLVVAIGCTLAARAMNKKKAAETKSL